MLWVLLNCGLWAVRVTTKLVSTLRYARGCVLVQESLHPRNYCWFGVREVVSFLLITFDVVEAERFVSDCTLCRDGGIRARPFRARPAWRNRLSLLHVVSVQIAYSLIVAYHPYSTKQLSSTDYRLNI